MDIIDYINSNDIREYLHDISYKLRTDEAMKSTNNPITKEFHKMYYDELIEI